MVIRKLSIAIDLGIVWRPASLGLRIGLNQGSGSSTGIDVSNITLGKTLVNFSTGREESVSQPDTKLGRGEIC